MRTFTKADIVCIAKQKSIQIEENWSGPGQIWPIVEEMMIAGCVVVVKLDGVRNHETDDNGNYTLIASDGPLGDVLIRGDFHDLDDGLCYLTGNYFEVVGDSY